MRARRGASVGALHGVGEEQHLRDAAMLNPINQVTEPLGQAMCKAFGYL
jgi:hypothetical protein